MSNVKDDAREWIAEDDWTTVKRDQTVRLELGTSSVTVLVASVRRHVDIHNHRGPSITGSPVSAREPNWNEYAKDSGWALFIEKATPPLPAEPGHYLDPNGRCWLHQIHDGSAYGVPARDVDQWLDPWGNVHEAPEKHAPFTRLEPVADTVKKVLDEVRSRAITRGTDSMTVRFLVLENIAADFGVQS